MSPPRLSTGAGSMPASDARDRSAGDGRRSMCARFQKPRHGHARQVSGLHHGETLGVAQPDQRRSCRRTTSEGSGRPILPEAARTGARRSIPRTARPRRPIETASAAARWDVDAEQRHRSSEMLAAGRHHLSRGSAPDVLAATSLKVEDVESLVRVEQRREVAHASRCAGCGRYPLVRLQSTRRRSRIQLLSRRTIREPIRRPGAAAPVVPRPRSVQI